MAHQDARDLADGRKGRGYTQRVPLAVPAWLRKPSPLLVDVALAAGVAALQVATASVRSEADQHPVQIALFAAAIAAPLVIRRRWPLVALAAVLAIAFSSPVDVPFEFPMLIVIYTIGTIGSWEMAIAGSIVAVFGGAAVYADGADVNTSNLIALTLESAIATGIGAYIGSRRGRWTSWGSEPSASIASARSWPGRRSRKSAFASPRSSTTWSGTT